MSTSTKKRSVVQTQNVLVNKTPVSTLRMSMGGPGNVIERSTVRRSYAASGPMLKTGVAGQVTKEGVSNVIQTRDKEKEELTGLNTRLADYIDKTRFLEANCEALTAELERVKKLKNYDQDRVAELFKQEIEELRGIQDELEKKMHPLESKLLSKDDEIETLQEQLKDKEQEINRLNDLCRQLGDDNGDLEGECKKLKNEIERLNARCAYLDDQLKMAMEDNKRLRNDLEAAIAAQLDAAERAKDADEEREFTEQAYLTEIEDLRECLKNAKSNPIDMQAMWKKNFSQAVQELQDNYRNELARVCDENKRNYEERIRTMQMGMNRDNTDAAIAKSEVKTVKSQLNDNKNRLRELEGENEALRNRIKMLTNELDECRNECEKEKGSLRDSIEDLNEDVRECMDQINSLKDAKLSLEMEIATYRKLLEGEEKRGLSRFIQDQQHMQSRGGADLSSVIMGGSGGSSMQSKSREPLVYTMSESTGRINVKKTSKCAVSISDISHDGSMVKCENTSASRDFDLGGWSLERTSPKGKRKYAFPAQYSLKRGQSVKIFGADFKDDKSRGRDDIVADPKDCPDWGVGNGSFRLLNKEGECKAECEVQFR